MSFVARCSLRSRCVAALVLLQLAVGMFLYMFLPLAPPHWGQSSPSHSISPSLPATPVDNPVLQQSLHFLRDLSSNFSEGEDLYQVEIDDEEESGNGLCPKRPPSLQGPLHVLAEAPPLSQLAPRFPQLLPGGAWRPQRCTARSRVAVVVPFRDRAAHLSVLLLNLHPLLQRQQLDYRIVIVEQAAPSAFNRAMLMNVGFVEATALSPFDCFVFHDVDLVPEDDRILYTCGPAPTHLAVYIDVFHYRLTFPEIFGGVVAIRRSHFEAANGFSNLFFGWGGEDDNLLWRLRRLGLRPRHLNSSFARYKMLMHRRQNPNPRRFQLLEYSTRLFDTDGLSSLRYTRKDLILHPAYTHVVVDLYMQNITIPTTPRNAASRRDHLYMKIWTTVNCVLAVLRWCLPV